MYLLISPFVRTPKEGLGRIAEVNRLDELFAAIDSNHRWNDYPDHRVSRKLLPFEKKHEYWIILDLTTSRHYNNLEDQTRDTVSAEFLANMLATHNVLPIDPHHFAIPVLAFSEDYPNEISYTLGELFDQLKLVAANVCLDEEAFLIREQEYYDFIVDAAVSDRNLNHLAKQMLQRSEAIKSGMNDAQFLLDEEIEKLDNPFWFARIYHDWNIPAGTIRRVLKRRQLATLGMAQQRFPWPMRKQRVPFSKRFRGICVAEGRLTTRRYING